MDQPADEEGERQDERHDRRIDLGCHCHAKREAKADGEKEERVLEDLRNEGRGTSNGGYGNLAMRS